MEIHGGNIYDQPINLDFSISVNPLGFPEKARKEAIRGVELAEHYPDINYRALREAISNFVHAKGEEIALGNGATELIYALVHVKKPKKALIVGPTFIEYQRALETIGCAFDYYLAKEDNSFLPEEDLYEQITKKEYDMVFICNPNNPTGGLISPLLLEKIMNYCEAHHIQVLLDECFMDFVKHEEEFTYLSFYKKYHHLVILRAFTKIFAMPGLRLGYCISSDQEVIDRIRKGMPPWNVSVPAQFAGAAAIKEMEYIKESKAFISSERSWMEDQLSMLGFKVIPSKANFILFQGPVGLQEECLKKDILIRDAASFNGIKEGYYRIGLKKRRYNEQLLKVLKGCLARRKED